MERIYNKLVRDNIPKIIEEKNETPIIRILNDAEYKEALEKKLYEEYKEVLDANESDRVEAIADMLEVIKSLASLANKSLDNVISLMNAKSEKRGSFKERIFLEKVIEK